MIKNFDRQWTLFLDRDGVINRRTPNDYIKRWEDFEFEAGVIAAIVKASNIFGRIVVVTNQSGLEKRIVTEDFLQQIHLQLVETIQAAGGKIDKVYYCPHKAFSRCQCRKPATGMAFQAKDDFEEIDFSKSVMVGDSISDMEFGKKLGMLVVLVEGKMEEWEAQRNLSVDVRAKNLAAFIDLI
jgi:D-glycero-D-manno-heptose 1,7-bisphosphate phosphatase